MKEIYEPFFMGLAGQDGRLDASLLTGPVFKCFSNRLKNQLGRGPLDYIENLKVPFTLNEISAMLSSGQLDLTDIVSNYTNYTGTFEFSDGTKKTYAELLALLS